MATMWPRRLPDWVLRDGRRGAEIKVYKALESQLDDAWRAYYSRPWLGIGRRGEEIEGEADFIVAHPQHGLLFLEVKGGAISYLPDLDQWRSRSRRGETSKIKDPIKQASGCQHAYLRKLRDDPQWPRGFKRLRHGAVFPDTGPFAADAQTVASYERFLFCDGEQFEQGFGRWVQQRLSPHGDAEGGAVPLGERGLEVLHRRVAAPLELSLRLSSEVEGDLSEMDRLLTGAQLFAMDALDQHRRAVVSGGAGTGKTLLALEYAIRSAERGASVAVLCRSKVLAGIYRGRLGDNPVRVLSMPELLSARRGPVKRDIGVFDAVLVDEAQDVPWDTWAYVEGLVEPAQGRLFAFADSNQAIYELAADLPTKLNAATIELRSNLRNTVEIARATDHLYSGPLIRPAGPDGAPPVVVDTGDPAATTIEVIKDLIGKGLTPASLAILVPDESTKSQMLRALGDAGVPCADAAGYERLAATVETVRDFKGLESPVVVLLADRQLAKDRELAYVAISRARSRLHVVGPVAGTPLGRALADQLA